jgi:hypothetical protein
MVVFTVIGVVATFMIAYYTVSTKFPKLGNKINSAVVTVGNKFKFKKNSETVEDLDKLDK